MAFLVVVNRPAVRLGGRMVLGDVMDPSLAIGIAGLVLAMIGIGLVQTTHGRTVAGEARRSVSDAGTRVGRRVGRGRLRRQAISTEAEAWSSDRDPVLEKLGVDVRWIGYREDHAYFNSDVRVSHLPDHWGLPDGEPPFYLAKSTTELVALSRGIDPELASRSIDLVKDRIAALPASQRGHFFNGSAVRLEGVRTITSGADFRPGLEIHTSVSNYYTGWAGLELARHGMRKETVDGLPSGMWPRQIAVTGYLITSDRRLVFTKRSAFVARNAGRFGPTVSGNMSPDEDRTPRGPSIFRAVSRECGEEVGVTIAGLVEEPGWQLDGIAVYGLEEQPVFVFHATVKATAHEVEAATGEDRQFEHGGAGSFPTLSMEPGDLKAVAEQIVDSVGDWEPISLAALVVVLRRWHGSASVDAAFAVAANRPS